jgi:nicotinate dehydrogenase subunit B
LDWSTYPILNFRDVPEIDIVLINPQDVEPLGAGELSTVPIPAAIASAIFDAVGIKLREVPFTAKRVLAELQKKT